MEKLLRAWARSIAEAECAKARAYCATPGARARALYQARQAERRAARLAQILQTRYGVDPYAALARGEIK
jgi:protein tyrosine phosphatase (PTP) superfamily phosphohydrolase (DUF442 family)